jgi:hypothetical protein
MSQSAGCVACKRFAKNNALDFVVSLPNFTYCSLLRRVHMVGAQTFWTLHSGCEITAIKTNASLDRERDPVADGMFEMDEEASDFAGVLFADCAS